MAKISNLIEKQNSQEKNNIGSLKDLLANSEIITKPKVDSKKKKSFSVDFLTSFRGYDGKKSLGKPEKPILSESKETSKKFDEKATAKIIQLDLGIKKISKDTVALPKIVKNTSSLSKMAKDTNITRQNVMRMVKLLGGKEQTRADDFFKTAGEKEEKYESKFVKSPKATSPTPEKATSKKTGMFGDIFGSITGFLPSLFKGLLVGGLIAAAVGQLAKDPAMLESMKGMVVTVFQSMKDGFKALSEILKDPKVQEAIREAIGAFFSMLGDLLDVKVFGDVSLGGALLGIVTAMVGLKLAMTALSAFIMKKIITAGAGGLGACCDDMMSGLPGGERGRGRGRDGGRGRGRGRVPAGRGLGGLGVGLLAGGGLLAAGAGLARSSAESESDGAEADQTRGTDWGNVGMNTAAAGLAGVSAVQSAGAIMGRGSEITKGAKTATTAIKTIPKGTMLSKFLEFAKVAVQKGWMSKIVGKLGARLGEKIAVKAVTFLAGLAVPGPGWVMSAISMALLAFDAYIIYDAIFGKNGIYEELMREEGAETKPQAAPKQEQSEPTQAPQAPDTASAAIENTLKQERESLISGITGQAPPPQPTPAPSAPKTTTPKAPVPAPKTTSTGAGRPAGAPSAFAKEVDAMASAGQEYWTGGKSSQPTPTPTSVPNLEKTPSTQKDQKVEPFKGNQKQFYESMYNSLFESAKKQGIENPEVIAHLGATQSALETGYGKHLAGGNNYFGIKAKPGDQTASTQSTQEFINGKYVTINDKFRRYNSMQESADDYIKFLKENSRYKDVLKAKTVEEAISAQGKTGYATDPNYASKLSSIHARGSQSTQLASASPSSSGGGAGQPTSSGGGASPTMAAATPTGSGASPTMAAATPSSPSVESSPAASQRGQAIGATSMEVADASRASAAPVVINNNTNNTTNSGGGQQQQIAKASSVADPDFAELLFQRAGGFVGA